MEVGDRFNRLVVQMVYRKGGRIYAHCKCDCGGVKTVLKSNLLHKNPKSRVQSCGCLRNERVRDAVSTHGMSGSREYDRWRAMVERCTNPNHIEYHQYGGRGITMYQPWEKFMNFLMDMGDMPSPSYSLERIRVNEGYSPSNCKWIPRREQAWNRQDTVYTSDGCCFAAVAWENEVSPGRARGLSRYIISSEQVIDFCKNAPIKCNVRKWFRENRGVNISLRPKVRCVNNSH